MPNGQRNAKIRNDSLKGTFLGTEKLKNSLDFDAQTLYQCDRNTRFKILIIENL